MHNVNVGRVHEFNVLRTCTPLKMGFTSPPPPPPPHGQVFTGAKCYFVFKLHTNPKRPRAPFRAYRHKCEANKLHTNFSLIESLLSSNWSHFSLYFLWWKKKITQRKMLEFEKDEAYLKRFMWRKKHGSNK